MNNKGQSLILFVIIIPVIISLFLGIVDLGMYLIEKKEINNTLENAIVYYNDNKTDLDIKEKIKVLINKNIDDISNLNIDINNNSITIKLYKARSGLIDNIEVIKKG